VSGKEDAKETIFMIHGWPDNKEVWDAQVAHLGDRYRILRVDLPNFAEASGVAAFGWSFEELAELCAATVRADLAESGQKRVILVRPSAAGLSARVQSPHRRRHPHPHPHATRRALGCALTSAAPCRDVPRRRTSTTGALSSAA